MRNRVKLMLTFFVELSINIIFKKFLVIFVIRFGARDQTLCVIHSSTKKSLKIPLILKSVILYEGLIKDISLNVDLGQYPDVLTSFESNCHQKKAQVVVFEYP